MREVAWRTAIGTATVILAACSPMSPSQGTRPPAPAAVPMVTITMRDHRFEYPGQVPAGRVLFRVRNAGQATHHLTMVPLPESLPPIVEQLRGTERRFLSPFAGIYDRKSGDTGTFVADLEPGRRYALICSVRGEDAKPHWMKGMASEFRTPGVATNDATTTSGAPPAG